MRIDEALKAVFDGERIRHEDWIKGKYVYYASNTNGFYKDNDESYHFVLDYANTDRWELYKPQHGFYQSGNVIVFYDGKFRYFKVNKWDWTYVDMSVDELMNGYKLISETDNINDFKVCLGLEKK